MKFPISKLLNLILKISLTVFLFLCIERLTHTATDGFSIIRITHPLPKAPLSLERHEAIITDHLKEILSQKFRYLSSGAQSYVFQSDDKGYVLKFFKFHHLRAPLIVQNLFFKTLFASYSEKKLEKKQTQLNKAFTSHEIAYTDLRELTNLKYLHLNQTNHLNQTLHIVDKIGIHYHLSADAFAFALQKKGSLVYPTLNKLIIEGKTSEAKKAIYDLLDLIQSRCKKGVADLDPDFSTNFAFLDSKPFQIDLGRFEYNLYLKEENERHNELIRSTSHFKKWLKSHHPYLLSDYEQYLSKNK